MTELRLTDDDGAAADGDAAALASGAHHRDVDALASGGSRDRSSLDFSPSVSRVGALEQRALEFHQARARDDAARKNLASQPLSVSLPSQPLSV